jgi:ribosomal protein L19E
MLILILIMDGVIKIKREKNNSKAVIRIIMCFLVRILWRKIRNLDLSIGWMNNVRDDRERLNDLLLQIKFEPYYPIYYKNK